MKFSLGLFTLVFLSIISVNLSAQTGNVKTSVYKPVWKNLYIDVHQLEPGKVNFESVAEAHKKDIAVQSKYGVSFLKYWVNEEKGLVYCLSSSGDESSIRKTHAEAHGLLPTHIYMVTGGNASSLRGVNELFLDVHYLGAGNVTANAVAAAHKKDLAVQKKYGVNFINYWVDEKEGTVMCLSEAKDSSSVINTHKAAHGLLPAFVIKVKQGQ